MIRLFLIPLCVYTSNSKHNNTHSIISGKKKTHIASWLVLFCRQSKAATSCFCVPCHCSLFLSASFPHAAARFSVYSSGLLVHGAAVKHGGPTHNVAFFPSRLLLPQRRAGTRLHLLQPYRRCTRLEGRCRVRGVAMPSSDRSRMLGRSNPPVARDGCGSGRRGQWQSVALGFGVVVAASPLPPDGSRHHRSSPCCRRPMSLLQLCIWREQLPSMRHTRDPGEGAGMHDLACCRLVKTASTTRRRAYAPPRATGQLRRLARRHRGRR
jgi:hypothetical protein